MYNEYELMLRDEQLQEAACLICTKFSVLVPSESSLPPGHTEITTMIIVMTISIVSAENVGSNCAVS